jgi:ABC-2 type transport system ATP-binding protein
VTVGGHDIITGYRAARSMIGLVPQEINLEPFEKVINTVRFSRGLFGKPKDDAALERILRQLSLWDKKDSQIRALSGGMKRRVLIAKALAHDPRVLFLDEPTAGVDVELRKDMWEIVADLKADGVTIILTTHYIEEAEAIADRVGVIAHGALLLIEDKAKLMARMGKKQLEVQLSKPIKALPKALQSDALTLSEDGTTLIYTYDTRAERTGITKLLADVSKAGLVLTDVMTRQSSLEDIFVDLVQEDAA